MSEHRVVVTRHSNLSNSAHCIFHLYVGRAHAEKSIESRHPTLLALRTIIRESAQVTKPLSVKNLSRSAGTEHAVIE